MWLFPHLPVSISCSASFQFFFRGNCSIYNCRFAVSMGRWEFRIFPCHHFELPPNKISDDIKSPFSQYILLFQSSTIMSKSICLLKTLIFTGYLYSATHSVLFSHSNNPHTIYLIRASHNTLPTSTFINSSTKESRLKSQVEASQIVYFRVLHVQPRYSYFFSTSIMKPGLQKGYMNIFNLYSIWVTYIELKSMVRQTQCPIHSS